MGQRICLTEEQRRAEAARQMRLRLARAVAGYRNEHRLTCSDMAGQLGISPPTLRKLLRAEDVSLTLSTTHRLLRLAGVDI